MFKLRNGWTKEKMKEAIATGNTGQRSISVREGDRNGVCMYRSETGNKCAVGCFIPEKDYERRMDDQGSALGLLGAYPGLDRIMPLTVDGMNELQKVHDIVPKEFESRMCRMVDVPHKDVRIPLYEWIDNNVEE